MRLRPMVAGDAPAVLEVLTASFADLERRMGTEPAPPPADDGPGLLRIRHLVGSDPGGAWVTEDDDGAVDGATLALVREGLWGLSLLVVQPGRQSGGRGSALLRAALGHAEGTRGGIILASEDPRALRAYWRAGFALRPSFDARGPVRDRPSRPAAVRPLEWPADRALVDAASRAVRGASHATEVLAWLGAGAELLAHDDGGFLVRTGGRVLCVAATSEPVARELLRAALADATEDVQVDFLDAAQDWAFDEVLGAGVQLWRSGAVAVRGEVGPLRPYLPSGAYL